MSGFKYYNPKDPYGSSFGVTIDAEPAWKEMKVTIDRSEELEEYKHAFADAETQLKLIKAVSVIQRQ